MSLRDTERCRYCGEEIQAAHLQMSGAVEWWVHCLGGTSLCRAEEGFSNVRPEDPGWYEDAGLWYYCAEYRE